MKKKEIASLSDKATILTGFAVLVIAGSAFFIGLRFPSLHIGSPAIIGTLALDTRDTQQTVIFGTIVPTRGYLFYSETEPTLDSASIGGLYTREMHHITMPNLKPDTQYRYFVLAIDPVTGARGLSATYTFRTAKPSISSSGL